MSSYQFNRAVRIAPRPGKGKPQVFAAGSVHKDLSPEITNHPHFKKFQKAGAISAYVPKPPPKALQPGTLTVGKNPSAVDGRVKMEAEKTATGGVHSKATAAAPETVVGGDDGEDADETSDDSDDSSDSKPSKSGKSKKGGRGK